MDEFKKSSEINELKEKYKVWLSFLFDFLKYLILFLIFRLLQESVCAVERKDRAE
jgi:hypothetical protein